MDMFPSPVSGSFQPLFVFSFWDPYTVNIGLLDAVTLVPSAMFPLPLFLLWL